MTNSIYLRHDQYVKRKQNRTSKYEQNQFKSYDSQPLILLFPIFLPNNSVRIVDCIDASAPPKHSVVFVPLNPRSLFPSLIQQPLCLTTDLPTEPYLIYKLLVFSLLDLCLCISCSPFYQENHLPFINSTWRPEVAVESSPSPAEAVRTPFTLARCTWLIRSREIRWKAL